MKRTFAAVAATITGLLLAAAAPAAAVVPETPIRPAELDRGPAPAIPYLQGKTVVDGSVHVRIRAGLVTLLGKSDGEYVVGTSDRNGDGRFRVFRVTSAGQRTLLIRDVPIFGMVLSRDGAQIGLATARTADHSRVRVWSAVDGHRQALRRFPGSVSILDFDAHRLVLGSWGPNRTFWWNASADTTSPIVDRAGYSADIRADRYAAFTKDPYNGGCSVVATLSAPRQGLWKSCQERVEAFAPHTGRMAAVHILTDGLGPREVRVHRTGGGLLARYTTSGWFGALTWETGRALLLDTHGAKKSALVRCELARCERASALRDTRFPRVSAGARPAARP